MKRLMSVITILSISLPYSTFMHANASPYFRIRSQGDNVERDLIAMTDHINLADQDQTWGTLSVTGEFGRSFRPGDISRCLFGTDINCQNNRNSISISGSGVANRDAQNDWLADNLMLPRDYEGTITFVPKIENYITDLRLHLGFDDVIIGLYLTLQTTAAHTRWNLNFCETPINLGRAAHPQGYFTTQSVNRNNLYCNATEYFNGSRNLGIENEVDGTVNIVTEKLKYARFAPKQCHKLTQTKFTDLRASLGWNFLLDRDKHAGIGLRAAAPLGNRPKGIFVFEPIAGNGGHWEIGAFFSAHKLFWQNKAEEKHLGFWFELDLTHLFGARQQRTFDLCGKQNSRYMLAQKMRERSADSIFFNNPQEGDPATNGTQAQTARPSHIFDNRYTPVANLTTARVHVNMAIRADLVAMFTYTHGGTTFDFGYGLWATSCEKIKLDCTCPTPLRDGKTWALKGDSHVYGFNNEFIPNVINPGDPVALSATQSMATIHAGTNNFVDLNANNGGINGIRATRNPGVDNSRFAFVQASGIFSETLDRTNAVSGQEPAQTKTSPNPVFLSEQDIDLKGAQTKGLSQKLFMHLNYSWLESDHIAPYLGLGFELEFASNKIANKQINSIATNSTKCKASCNGCSRCSLSQWGFWIKGGISFN